MKKLWNIKVPVILIVVGTLETDLKGIERRLGGDRKSDYPDRIIVKISQNTQKSTEDLSRLIWKTTN